MPNNYIDAILNGGQMLKTALHKSKGGCTLETPLVKKALALHFSSGG
jgi:hypothetical protein